MTHIDTADVVVGIEVSGLSAEGKVFRHVGKACILTEHEAPETADAVQRASGLQAQMRQWLTRPLQPETVMPFHSVATFLAFVLIARQQAVPLGKRIGAAQEEVLTRRTVVDAVASPRIVEEIGVGSHLQACQRLCLKVQEYAAFVLGIGVFGKRTAVERTSV